MFFHFPALVYRHNKPWLFDQSHRVYYFGYFVSSCVSALLFFNFGSLTYSLYWFSLNQGYRQAGYRRISPATQKNTPASIISYACSSVFSNEAA